MAGLVPAIHAFLPESEGKAWMPATIPGSSPGTGMTRLGLAQQRGSQGMILR